MSGRARLKRVAGRSGGRGYTTTTSGGPLSEPHRTDEARVTLELVSDADGAPSPSRQQLVVEVHAARSHVAALRAVIEAQRAHIRQLLDELHELRSKDAG